MKSVSKLILFHSFRAERHLPRSSDPSQTFSLCYNRSAIKTSTHEEMALRIIATKGRRCHANPKQWIPVTPQKVEFGNSIRDDLVHWSGTFHKIQNFPFPILILNVYSALLIMQWTYLENLGQSAVLIISRSVGCRYRPVTLSYRDFRLVQYTIPILSNRYTRTGGDVIETGV